GLPDGERVFTDQVTNCQGLLFEGPHLYAVGVGPEGTGLYHVLDTDEDGIGDRVETITLNRGPIGEHGPHALIIGADGYLYWVLGNHTALTDSSSFFSPHRNYEEGNLLPYYTDPRGHAANVRAPGGTIARTPLSSPGSQWELFAGGFRNAYD